VNISFKQTKKHHLSLGEGTMKKGIIFGFTAQKNLAEGGFFVPNGPNLDSM